MSDSMSATNEQLPELLLDIPEIIYKDKKYTELSLSEPSMKTVREATAVLRINEGFPTPDSTFAYFTKLVSGHTGLPTNVIENLPVSIVNRGGEYLAGFTNAGISEAKN